MKKLDFNRVIRFILFVVLCCFIIIRMGYKVTTFEYGFIIFLVILLECLSYIDGFDDGWKALGNRITDPLNELEKELKKMEVKRKC